MSDLNCETNFSDIPSVSSLRNSNKPYVEIIEQPASRSLKFRYECELKGRSAGNIVGVHNTAQFRTYPTIKVINYQGPYTVVVSCVTKDGPPYRPHPHNLVDKENCKKGVYSVVVNNPQMTCSFKSLNIQRTKERDIEKSLSIREAQNLDPFGTGFNHPGSIDLDVVRLCFQVFIRGPDKTFSLPLEPVVSDPIYDKKSNSQLTIVELSHQSAPVTGGTKVILLCDRVSKEDIQIWFYEEQDARIVWENQANFRPNDVYKQVAISFRTPPYHNDHIQHDVKVFVQLRKPSKNMRGEPCPFFYLPIQRMSVPVECLSDSSHLPPVLTSSSDAYSQASATPPLSTLPTLQQMMQPSPKANNTETHDVEDEEIREKVCGLNVL